MTSHTVFKDLLPPDTGIAPEMKNLTSENNNHKQTAKLSGLWFLGSEAHSQITLFFVLTLVRKEDMGFRLKCLRTFIGNGNPVTENSQLSLFH